MQQLVFGHQAHIQRLPQFVHAVYRLCAVRLRITVFHLIKHRHRNGKRICQRIHLFVIQIGLARPDSVFAFPIAGFDPFNLIVGHKQLEIGQRLCPDLFRHGAFNAVLLDTDVDNIAHVGRQRQITICLHDQQRKSHADGPP